MSNRTISKTAADLIKARALIEDEGKWCQGAITRHGQLCAVGAYKNAVGLPLHSLVSGWTRAAAFRALKRSARALFNTVPSSVNDRHGHAAVMRMYDQAIQSELNKTGG